MSHTSRRPTRVGSGSGRSAGWVGSGRVRSGPKIVTRILLPRLFLQVSNNYVYVTQFACRKCILTAERSNKVYDDVDWTFAFGSVYAAIWLYLPVIATDHVNRRDDIHPDALLRNVVRAGR
jgi:hypothetical protein